MSYLDFSLRKVLIVIYFSCDMPIRLLVQFLPENSIPGSSLCCNIIWYRSETWPAAKFMIPEGLICPWWDSRSWQWLLHVLARVVVTGIARYSYFQPHTQANCIPRNPLTAPRFLLVLEDFCSWPSIVGDESRTVTAYKRPGAEIALTSIPE